uniref:Membrane protein n=1 Tax=Panulirus argus virus 1 TaxID=380624 RepID=A0A6G9HDT1_9VIRU|nr:membrane protein [Panulirus argus virus 1]
MNVLLVIILVISFIIGYHCLTNRVDADNRRTVKTTTAAVAKRYDETAARGLCPGCVQAIRLDTAYCPDETSAKEVVNDSGVVTAAASATTTTTFVTDPDFEEYL